jgi:hypothetical protein
MSELTELLTTNRKALTLNLDEQVYGTFAEIGAGQEVARLFFQAGNASKTVAKTISAYDMTFSDAIYGKAPRYVSRERLATMLDHEYALLIERLAGQRGERSTFFVFADTVATRGQKGGGDAHGWMGVRFQTEPGSAPSEVVLHVRMWDKDTLQQQAALGIAGTNLIYAAFKYRADPHRFVESLVDNLGANRLEVDMVDFSGPGFATLDRRLVALHLVRAGLTNAVMFGPRGEVLQPSEALFRKAVLVERGSFRPVTHVHVDMLKCATAQFIQEPAVRGKEVVVLMEITMNNLLAAGDIDAADFLSRVDLLGELGLTTLISNYSEYYRLTSYFRRYTREMIGVAMGVSSLVEIFNEKYYEHLEGGILESFGRMFRHDVKLYVYPMLPQFYERHVRAGDGERRTGTVGHAFPHDVLITAKNVKIAVHLQNLYAHLVENHSIDILSGYDQRALGIDSRDVLAKIRAADPAWEQMVPAPVAKVIRERGLFGLRAG